MIKFVNAKINIGLQIVRRRDDGYHELRTIFYPIGLYSGTPMDFSTLSDCIEAVPSIGGGSEFVITGDTPDCKPEQNLVCRAWHLFSEYLELRGLKLPSLRLILDKHLPYGAGMGGGSADASFTLLLLNELMGNPFTSAELEQMGLRLGADCPFFIRNRPCLAEGVGEVLTSVEERLKGWWCAVIKPDIIVSTKDAFSGVRPKDPDFDLLESYLSPIDMWKERIVNDFEQSVFKLSPRFSIIKKCLYEAGATYASMTGSGSALFGLFRDKEKAGEACRRSGEKFAQIALL